jgi:DNA-binding IclR family transcriptional regulator
MSIVPRAEETEESDAYAVGPINRALALVEILAAARAPLSLTQLAQQANLPKSTTLRLLGHLLKADVIVRASTRYGPGPRLRDLTRRLAPDGLSRIGRLVMPQLVRLHDETGLEVAFATLRHGHVHIESFLYSARRVPALTTLPLRAPLHCTCTGKVLLAHSDNPAALLARSARPAPERYTSNTITDIDSLQEELSRVRDSGMAYNAEEYVPGVQGMAVPVLGVRARVFGSLAVCGRPGEVRSAAVGTALRRLAFEVTETLRRAAME